MGILEGKSTVITGAGRGIGKACVECFVREGARVLAVDISGAEKDTAAEYGSAVVPHHADVSNEEDIAAMVDSAVDAFGRLDAQLNVAGTQAGRSEDDYLSAEEY